MAEQSIQLTKLASCAGCGAKVGAGVLAQLLGGLKVHSDPRLLVGFDKSDDASVYQVTDELALVQTVDFFPPIADDPYLFGQIAATNALSDVYAMGGEPKLALNLLCIPESMPKEAVHQLLRGGYDKAYEAGVIITGGHSILDPEPKYGLAVTGFVHPKKLLTNSAARPGDVLLLTKPIGIGVLTTAAKAELASPEAMALAHRLMTTLNKAARDCMVRYAVHACTDVTGFGLLGHAFEMAQGSDTHLTLFPGEIDLIPEALEFARDGILPFTMMMVNDADCKHLFDNRYGTGQSVWDGIMRTTNLIVAGKYVVVSGYGWCGKGVALRAAGLGAKVIVTEPDPVHALEAVMDGYEVMPMREAAKLGDIFCTVTGCRDIITKEHFGLMKDGAILTNAGHFDVEIDMAGLKEYAVRSYEARHNITGYELPEGKTLFVIAEGRLVNLAAADGHPAEIMDMSFAIQALSAEYLAKNRGSLPCAPLKVPEEIDKAVARRKLASMGVEIDEMNDVQREYLGI